MLIALFIINLLHSDLSFFHQAFVKHQFGFINNFQKIHLISDKLPGPGPLFLDGWIYIFSVNFD